MFLIINKSEFHTWDKSLRNIVEDQMIKILKKSKEVNNG